MMSNQSIRNGQRHNTAFWGRLFASLMLSIVLLAATACHKKSADELLGDANQLLRSQEPVGAEVVYEKILDQFPGTEQAIKARFGLYACYRQYRDFGLAREQMDLLIQEAGGPSTPTGFTAFVRKLDTYVQEKHFDTALKEALDTSPTLSTADPAVRNSFALQLGDLYRLNEQPAKAIESYQSLVGSETADPDHDMPPLDRILRVYEDLSQFDQAIALIDDYLAKNADTPLGAILNYRKGLIQNDKGDAEAAKQAFLQAEQILKTQLEAAPGAEEKSDVLLMLSDVQYRLGNFEGTRQCLRTIIDEYPCNLRPTAMTALAGFEETSGNTEGAIQILKQLVQEYPETPAAAQAAKAIASFEAKLSQSGATTSTLETLPGQTPTSPSLQSEIQP